MRWVSSNRTDRPISVIIGRIVVRLAVVALIIWGGLKAYALYQEHLREQEIAPVHEFAKEILGELKSGDLFVVQEKLNSKLHHEVSIDWLAHFAEYLELNATQKGSWGDWNKSIDANTTVYEMTGKIVYTTGHTNPMVWKVMVHDGDMSILKLQIGKRRLPPCKRSRL